MKRIGINVSAFACAAVVLTGCAVDQRKEVALYRDILNSNALPPATQPAPADVLTLTQAMSLANSNSESLGLRGEDYVQALINKNRAVANFLPTVSLQPSYTIEDRPGGGADALHGLRASGDTARGYSVPAVGGINLFNGFGDVANLRAAVATIAQRRDLLLDLQSTVLLNVAQVYYQVLRSDRAVQVLANSLELQESRLRDVDQQLRNGLATQLSVSQTRAQVDDTRVQLIQAQSDVRYGRLTLANIIGLPAVPNPLIDHFVLPDEPLAEAAYEQQAVENRQDLRAAERQLEAARANVDVAISQYYPSVTLNVGALLGSEAYRSASKWNAVLSANVPLFSAGRIRADVRTAWSQLRQAALNESATRRQTLADVQGAYENFATAGRRVQQLEDEVKAADAAYQQARAAYVNGLGINLDVLTSQNQLLNSQLQLTGAQFDRTVFYLDLIRATGRLVDTVAATTRPTAVAFSDAAR